MPSVGKRCRLAAGEHSGRKVRARPIRKAGVIFAERVEAGVSMSSGSSERSAATAPCADRFLVGLVDDDISFREALHGWLSACGVKVVAFASADELLSSSQVDRISCLVLDVRMPGMNGLALCREVKILRGTLPVIFVSSQDDPRTQEHAAAAGATAFLSKPLDSANLLAVIEALREG